MTLIEKLEQGLINNAHKFDNWDNGFKAAIEIIKEHSEWISVDEYKKTAKANDRVFVYDTFCEVVMPSLVRVINDKVGFQLTNGLYAMRVTHVCIMDVPNPPSEMQDD